jgi:Mor family transcriptional regulator
MEHELFNPALMSTYQILDALNLEIRSDKRAWPSLLLELVAVVASLNMKLEKLEPKKAIEKAQDVIIVIAHHLGGRTMYLPFDDRLKQAIKDVAMFRVQDYENHREMVIKAKFSDDSRIWPFLLIELIDILAKFYEEREELDPDLSMEKVRAVILTIANCRGGRAMYIPRDDKLKLAIRDQAIFKAFNGSNHFELSI